MAAFYENGKYRIRLRKHAFGENTKGNPQVQFPFDIIGIYQGNELSKFDGLYPRKIFLTLTEGTLGTADEPGWVMKTLTFLGFTGQSFAQLDPDHKEAASFEGLEFDASCTVEEYEGKDRENWQFLRYEDNGPKPMEKKAIRALDAKFGKLLKSKVNGTPVAAAVAAATAIADSDPRNDPPPPGRRDDDIPF